MLREFPGSDLAELSWVFNGYTIAFTATLLPAGGLADRFGRRRVFLAGLTVFVACAAVCAIAPSPGVLIAARVVQGAGGGVITPLGLALILPWFGEEGRGTGIGLWSAVQSVAVASGPALGGSLVTTWDWRTIFWLHLPVGVAAIAGAWLTLPRDRVVRQGPQPLEPRANLKVRTTLLSNAAMFVLGLVLFALSLAAVLFLTGVWGYSEARTGLAFTPGPAIQVLVAPLSGRLTRRFGCRMVALAGAVLLGGTVLLLAMGTTAEPSYVRVFLPALLLGGAGIAMLITALSEAAIAATPPSRLATGTALTVTSRALGAVIGLSTLAVVLSGVPRDSLGTYQEIWWVMAGLCGLLFAIVAGLPRRSVRPGV